MQSFEVEEGLPRLIKFEEQFQRTSIMLLLLYSVASVYDIFDLCYSIYKLVKIADLDCGSIKAMYSANVLSDVLFWVASVLLYMSVKYTSVRRFKKFTWTMYLLIIFRLFYTIAVQVAQSEQLPTDPHECFLDGAQVTWKTVLYLLENLFYVITVGTVHYLMQILENIKEQPRFLLRNDVKDTMII